MRKLTTEEWIEKARSVHGDRYDYSKAKYAKSNIKIMIVCKEHGTWEQTPSSHLMGNGCPECGIEKVASKKRLSIESFKEKANIIHNHKYDYSLVVYSNNNTLITVICPEHGEFQQMPADHLSGKGCAKCACNQKYTTEEFILKANKVHSNKYRYDKVNYIDSKTKVTIICPTHGEFEQQPNNHLDNKGCSKCSATGFNPDKPAILYYLKITTDDNQVVYKIGITGKTVSERFSLTDLSKIEIIKQKLYKNGQDAYSWEQKLLKMYKQYQYIGPNILESGNTELFTKDIIALYYEENNLI